MSSLTRPAPPDQSQRERALDARRSILVQAPAGSGKTDLLTRRFLRLLCEVDDPGKIVAITFTKAAAAEMRNRILSELEKAGNHDGAADLDDSSMEALAGRVLRHSAQLGWDLLKMPAQLRISTIDSFCRELALQRPLLSGLGGGLDVTQNAAEFYHRAARRTLEQIGASDGSTLSAALSPAVEALLLWRDNAWQEMETLLVQMLAQRDRWMQDFVLAGTVDWDSLREKLERPFAAVVSDALAELEQLFDQETRDEAMNLAHFSCGNTNKWLQCKLFQLSGFPCEPFGDANSLENARQGYLCLAALLLTKEGTLRKTVTVNLGFALDAVQEKRRIIELIDRLKLIPGFAQKLNAVRDLPPARYTDEDWQIIRACFTLLRHAAGELQVAFAEAGLVDFTEIAQVAQRVLQDEDGGPSDAALAIAEGIHHLLVDEFQDTSRRQHKLISSLVAAWPDFTGRTVFVVGDPMQSIYFFRDADAELFPRVRDLGLELPNGETLPLDHVPLSSNFRTTPRLVATLNDAFAQIFNVNDGSGIRFSAAQPARETISSPGPRFNLHLDFMPQTVRANSSDPDVQRRKKEASDTRQARHEAQTAEIVALILSHRERIEAARARGEKYRIAVLGRTYRSLDPIAKALHEELIPFRAVDLESLAERPEVLDALALARALFNAEDRVAWLGVLRAPWCGLSLADLHKLASADQAELLRRPVPELIAERRSLLGKDAQKRVTRLLGVLSAVPAMRGAHPAVSLGTWLEQVWLQLGGADCVDATGRSNVDLLWKCLDQLKEGEPGLLGSEFEAALEQLRAQPDPNAEGDYGVQLMTIHKSKGLEFEVVIVPDLQANSGRGSYKLLSWLERGIAIPDQSGDITEFLVAPLPSKGSESGKAKKWVERVYRDREWQETRRILYVAATRAREELHLFARPEYKVESDGSFSLCPPRDTLLSTAWPALESEVRARFDAWTQAPQETEIETIAAAEANLLVFPAPGKPALLRRLRADYQPPPAAMIAPASAADDIVESASDYERHEGGLFSRVMGIAVHALLEELARLRTAHPWQEARQGLKVVQPRIVSQLRSAGMELSQARDTAEKALTIVQRASHDSIAQWILSPHAGAETEVRWAGVGVGARAGAVREVRVDRIFRAGLTPESDGDECWWIIDYKTAQASTAERAATLQLLRSVFAPQLELYASVLRNLQGAGALVRAGIYYPRMLAFDWWEL